MSFLLYTYMLCSCKLVLLFRGLAGKDKACILTIYSLGMSIFNILSHSYLLDHLQDNALSSLFCHNFMAIE